MQNCFVLSNTLFTWPSPYLLYEVLFSITFVVTFYHDVLVLEKVPIFVRVTFPSPPVLLLLFFLLSFVHKRGWPIVEWMGTKRMTRTHYFRMMGLLDLRLICLLRAGGPSDTKNLDFYILFFINIYQWLFLDPFVHFWKRFLVGVMMTCLAALVDHCMYVCTGGEVSPPTDWPK